VQAHEDEQLGLALARLLRGLGELGDPPPAATRSYVAMLALATAQYGIPASAAVQLLFFTTAESQVTVASKSVPLGQSEAQRVLTQLLADIPGLVSQTLLLGDEDLGAYLPGLALASALHETQYSRLYRS
jgi:urease accessory protein